MSKIPHIVKSYRGNHIVWFLNSRQFILLKQPALDVFRMKIRNKDSGEMVIHLEKKFGIDPSAGRTLVGEIIRGIEKYNTPDNSIKIESNYLDTGLTMNHYSRKKYSLGKKIVSVAYENQIFESYLHPLISHLESSSESHQDFEFEMFSNNHKIILSSGSGILGTYSKEETNLLKGKIFFEMANIIHGIAENEWLMAVHASALTNGNKTILFSAAPGCGKTTMAALLLKNGFRLVSDDFVPVDRELKAYSFPVALSVKEGSLRTLLPYYPELAEKQEYELTPEKRVRYLAVNLHRAEKSDVFPLNEVVFIKYDINIRCKLKRLNRIEGLMRFLEQAYITPEPVCAKILLHWAVKANFYELIYSDNQIAINKVSKLFEYE